MKKITLSLDIELILETSSAGQLTSNTNVFFGDGRKKRSAQVQLMNIQYLPAVADAMLIVKAESRSTDNKYDTSIQFSDVKYVKPDTQYSVPLQTSGQEVHIMPLKAMRNNVEVRCTCMDFYWRFAMYNNKDKSLIGEPPQPYVKKTDRAPNNPDQVPGACKHITKLAEQLKLEGILK